MECVWRRRERGGGGKGRLKKTERRALRQASVDREGVCNPSLVLLPLSLGALVPPPLTSPPLREDF